jgi:hypothetical protein
MDSTQHLAFVLNGEKTWAHWGVICPETSGMMPITKTTFGLILALGKHNVKVSYIIGLPKCVVASTFEIAFNQLF